MFIRITRALGDRVVNRADRICGLLKEVMGYRKKDTELCGIDIGYDRVKKIL